MNKPTLPVSIPETSLQTKDAAYEAWKDRKINKALQQSQDRASMIEADKVWKDLGLED
jgi:mannose-1-phosphate guanylyltransferase